MYPDIPDRNRIINQLDAAHLSPQPVVLDFDSPRSSVNTPSVVASDEDWPMTAPSDRGNKQQEVSSGRQEDSSATLPVAQTVGRLAAAKAVDGSPNETPAVPSWLEDSTTGAALPVSQVSASPESASKRGATEEERPEPPSSNDTGGQSYRGMHRAELTPEPVESHTDEVSTAADELAVAAQDEAKWLNEHWPTPGRPTDITDTDKPERGALDRVAITEPTVKLPREQTEPTIVRVEVTDRGVPQVTGTHPDERDVVLGQLDKLQAAFTDFVPENAKFNDPGMDAFFAAKGLETAPVYVLTRDQIVELTEVLRQVGFPPTANRVLADLGARPGSNEAASISELGAAIVIDNEFTRSNSVLMGYIVGHERAHLSERVGAVVLRISNGAGSFNFMRAGQRMTVVRADGSVEARGKFLEEAFGASTGVEYVRDGLGLPNGEWDDSAPREAPDTGVYLPPAYVWPITVNKAYGPQSDIWVDKAAYAGFALDLLKQAVPTLAANTILARSSVQGLRGVAHDINQVQPGLYSELQKLPPTKMGYRAGLLAVQDALGMTAWNV